MRTAAAKVNVPVLITSAKDEDEISQAKTILSAVPACLIPGEEKFWNNGISACAVCDGANPLFANGALVVVGGGDTAAEEALYLTHFAKTVHLLVCSGQMRASQVMQEWVCNPHCTSYFLVQARAVTCTT